MAIVYRFCPMCAAPLERRAIPADGPERGVCTAPHCGFIHWGNSKTSASAFVVAEDGRILLSRRAHPPFAGLWDVPGGFLESGEHPETAVVRELREETGLEVRVESLVGIYMDTYGPPPSDDTLNFYYVCHVVGGVLAANDDAEEVAWFTLDEIPDPIAFDNANAALRDYIASDRGVA